MSWPARIVLTRAIDAWLARWMEAGSEAAGNWSSLVHTLLAPGSGGRLAKSGSHRDPDMRVMEILPFPRKIDIADLDNFLRTRLNQIVVMWPEQAIPLLGYLCCPNDPEARAALLGMLRTWQKGSEADPPAIMGRLGRIQNNWLRVADVFHLLSDLTAGRHQARRGEAEQVSGRPSHWRRPTRRAGGPELPVSGRSGRPTRMSPTLSSRRPLFVPTRV